MDQYPAGGYEIAPNCVYDPELTAPRLEITALVQEEDIAHWQEEQEENRYDELYRTYGKISGGLLVTGVALAAAALASNLLPPSMQEAASYLVVKLPSIPDLIPDGVPFLHSMQEFLQVYQSATGSPYPVAAFLGLFGLSIYAMRRYDPESVLDEQKFLMKSLGYAGLATMVLLNVLLRLDMVPRSAGDFILKIYSLEIPMVTAFFMPSIIKYSKLSYQQIVERAESTQEVSD